MDGTTAVVIIIVALILGSCFEHWVNRNKPDCEHREEGHD